jgi:hypothetical protein
MYVAGLVHSIWCCLNIKETAKKNSIILVEIFYHFSSCIHFLFFRRLDGYNRIL